MIHAAIVMVFVLYFAAVMYFDFVFFPARRPEWAKTILGWLFASIFTYAAGYGMATLLLSAAKRLW